jgi:ribosomal protein S19
MTKSIWKPPFINRDIRKILYKEVTLTPINTHSRRTTITTELVGRRFVVYNGRAYTSTVFTVTTNMVGHKLGEFSVTKSHGPEIHKDNKIVRKSQKRLKQLLAQKQKRRTKKINRKGKNKTGKMKNLKKKK